MDDLSLVVSSLEYKVKKIIHLQKKLEIENQQLNKGKKELLEIIEQQKESIKNLSEKYKISKLARSIEKGKETAEIKLKINEMVREVDKCISLLNR